MNVSSPAIYDLAVIGGGINGAGIARDAAGRGLKVLLVEQDDLASHTSSWSTKLIHGGLRYLEHYEFRLVAKRCRARGAARGRAAHHRAAAVRAAARAAPAAGVDDPLPGCSSTTISAAGDAALVVRRRPRREQAGARDLKPQLSQGLRLLRRRVDDARLVVLNAIRRARARRRRARAHAARSGPARRRPVARDAGRRRRPARRGTGARAGQRRRALGQGRAATTISPDSIARDVRHVKGSHIVVPRVHAEAHAYILQNADKRIVFVIPYERALLADRHDRRAGRRVSRRRASRADEIDYLLRDRQRLSRRARSPRPTSCGPTAACGRSTTTARRTRRR